MCTVLVLLGVHREFPVVVAANRDEYLSRPATGPRVLVETPRIVGGRDELAGGTWMAATPDGFFAALTNHHAGVVREPSLRSRGEIVIEALRAASAGGLEAVARYLLSLDPKAYNPFNVIAGNTAGLYVAYSRRDAPAVEVAHVPPGVHALLTDRLDPEAPKVVAPFRALPALADTSWPRLVPELRAIMANHDHPGLAAMCIHTPSYGTRSSSLLALLPGAVAHYAHADGPPCTVDYTDATALLTPTTPTA